MLFPNSPLRHSPALFICALFLILFSCSKDETIFEVAEKKGYATLQQLSLVKDLEARKIAYSILTSEERFDFWQTRLFLAGEKVKMNSDKFRKVSELNDALTLEYFSDPDQKAIFKTVFLPQWAESCKGILSTEELYDLFVNIEFERSIANSENKAKFSNVVVPFCHCAVGSSWTCFGFIPGTHPPVPNFGDCHKTSQFCIEASTGCGAFNDDECDGQICTVSAPS